MSPEQARGASVGRQTDIWAFGCVLYEMLSGRRAFDGQTVSDTLAAVLRADPDWSRVPADAPASVRHLLVRCLEKDPKRRLHDIADARIDVEEALADIRSSASGRTLSSPALPPPVSRQGRLSIAASIATAVALVAGFAAGRWTATRSAVGTVAPAAATRALVALPPGRYVSGWASPVLALSRDGRRLAFVAAADNAVKQLYVHHLDSGQTQLVPASDEAEGPFFSPDGEWVAFAVDVSGAPRPGQLKKFSLATGLTQTICGIRDYFGGDWQEDGTILFVEVPPEGLRRVPAAGGRHETVLSSVRLEGRDGPWAIFWPQRLPGGDAVLITYDGPVFVDTAVLDLRTRELRPLGIDSLYARYVPSGHLLFVHHDGTLMAAPFDPSRGRLSGAAAAVARNIAIGNNAGTAFTASHSGTLAYATGYLRGSGREPRRLVRIAPRGEPRPLPFDADTLGRWPRVSPDGTRIAITTWDGSLWIYDLSRRTRSRLPMGSAAGRDFPIWSPDGQRVVFASMRGSEIGYKFFWQKADGSAGPEPLFVAGTLEKHPGSLTPDGKALLFATNEPGKEGFHLLSTGEKGEPKPVLLDKDADMPTLSPDGRFLAYDSGETGQMEVFVQRFPEMGAKIQVSSGGGLRPRWTRDGRRLFYRSGDRVYAVRLEGGSKLHAGPPELFAEVRGMGGFDVMPDGREIVTTSRDADVGIVSQLQLVVNWSEELKRLAPAASR